MNEDYRTKGERQGLSPIFPRLFGMIAIIFLVVGLAACSKADPDTVPEPMDLTQVSVDLDAGTITGTTTAMEYSLNSTNGVDGAWAAASNGSTTVTFVEGRVYIREAANPTNVRLVVTIGSDNNTVVYLSDVEVNVAQGNITGTTVEMEYSLNSTDGTDGDWTAASDANTAVTFVAGRVYVRAAEDHTNKRLIAIIAAPADAPTLVGDDNANIIIGLTDAHEYRIDDGDWIAGTTPPDLTGEKSVEVRIKATATALASEIQTIVFTEDPLGIVLFEHHFDDGQELITDLKYTPGTTNVLISGDQYFSGTKSLAFLTEGGTSGKNVSRYFNPETTTETYENVTVELTAKVVGTASSFVIGLYNGATSVARINFFSGSVRYYSTTGSATQFSPIASITPDEWFKMRIEMTGNTFSVYKDEVLLGGGLATDGSATEVTRLYLNMANANADIFLDDIKVSYKNL